jgi:hypothetical protein
MSAKRAAALMPTHTRKASDKAVGRPDAQGTFELAVTGH